MPPNVDQVWFKEVNDGVINIGFTQDFLNSLDMCWHIMPASNVQFKKKSPLFTIETDDSLISVLSPVDGYYSNFNPKAQNFPDKIKASDTILTVVRDKQPSVAVDFNVPPVVMNRRGGLDVRWDEAINPVPQQPRARVGGAGGRFVMADPGMNQFIANDLALQGPVERLRAEVERLRGDQAQALNNIIQPVRPQDDFDDEFE
jgi:hypothetical protein